MIKSTAILALAYISEAALLKESFAQLDSESLLTQDLSTLAAAGSAGSDATANL